SLFFLMACWFILCMVFGQLSFTDKQRFQIKIHSKTPATLTGTVITEPKHKGEIARFILEATGIQTESGTFPASESFHVTLFGHKNILMEKGDRLTLTGYTRALNEWSEFDQNLRLNGITGKLIVPKAKPVSLVHRKENQFQFFFKSMKKKICRIIESTSIESQYKDILLALLFGNKSELNQEFKQSLIHQNVYHIFSVSGLHFGILGLIAIKTLGFFMVPKNKQGILAIPILFIFLGMVGFPPASTRAFMMLSLYWLAPVFSRQIQGMNLLGVVGILLLLITPKYHQDAGFILSFTAMIALMGPGQLLNSCFKTWSDKIEKKYQMDPNILMRLNSVKNLSSHICYSTGAWIGMFPIVIYYFKIFSLFSILTNLLAVYFMTPIMLCILLSVTCGAFWSMAAEAYAHAAAVLCKILVFFIHTIDKIPFSYLKTPAYDPVDVLFFYFIIAGIYFFTVYCLDRSKS
ncbi:MAG: ComEC/Rec2 family competence protein, partial [Candidatus Aureabacteria bacterium]|nr:ComEC/Rec2 family competence protein [Candidatus Auribacterota bacterium]